MFMHIFSAMHPAACRPRWQPCSLLPAPADSKAPRLQWVQVRQLAAYLAQRASQRAQRLQYTPATVTRVAAVGMGDRACVDLASMLVPGEGLCVGSFARGLFLVHSECSESSCESWVGRDESCERAL